MGLKGPLPPHLARLIDPKDQTTPATQTNSQAGAKARAGTEITEQRLFAAWLKRQGEAGTLCVVWHRPDKRSTATIGTPDFIIALCNGRTLWIELKAAGNSETDDQRAFREKLAKLAHSAFLAHSCADAIRLVRLYQSVL